MSGLGCFIGGFNLIGQPSLRRYFIAPVAINIFVLLGLLFVSYLNFEIWIENVMSLFPDWMSTLYWLVWGVALVVVVLSIAFCFVFIANVISSPFNALLSVRVEEYLTGEAPSPQGSVWSILPRTVGREIRKLLYILPRLALLFLITIIPLVNFFSPLLWIVFGGWMMVVQYTDYGADNNGVDFVDLKKKLQNRWFDALMFGVPAYLLLTIPVVNFILIPVGVAGGTKFWVERLKA